MAFTTETIKAKTREELEELIQQYFRVWPKGGYDTAVMMKGESADGSGVFAIMQRARSAD